MTKNIFRGIIAASLVVLLFTAAMMTGVLYRYSVSLTRSQMKTELGLASQGLKAEGASYFDGLQHGDVRITWIAKDGTVLYDSQEKDVSKMGNHRKRTEVREALRNGYGESDRYSNTLMRRMLYAAQKQSDGTVLRLAVTQYSVWMLLIGMIQPFVIIIVLAILLSLLLAMHLSKKIVRPLNELDLEHPLENENVDEVAPLLRRIDTQKRQLSWQEDILDQKQEELNTILDNMEEGMILLRRGGRIVSMNRPAAEILGIRTRAGGAAGGTSDPGGDSGRRGSNDSGSVNDSGSANYGGSTNYSGESLLSLCRNMDLAELVNSGLAGEAGSRVLTLADGRRYQVQVEPVREETGPAVKGVTVVLFDVTDRELGEEMRREFTANVSHELKTPLHAISGYAELLKGGVVQTEDIPHFSAKIYDEAQRTIRLVEDIISLSHLDEGAEDLVWEPVNLLEIAKDAAARLASRAAERDVTISVSGTDAWLEGNAAMLNQIAVNLTDNAVKYNREGGHVWVSVADGQPAGGSEADGVGIGGFESRPGRPLSGESQTITLTVKDDGIGIPREDQKRIFERFYRVDKSHSREIGGTGLGLSIVKHAVLAHHGKIALQSTPGEGTEITVTLPARQEKE